MKPPPTAHKQAPGPGRPGDPVRGSPYAGCRPGGSRFVVAARSPNQTAPGAPTSAGTPRKKIVPSSGASLRRLQPDHIDLYGVHARDVLPGVEELMGARDAQVRLGKVLSPAVSD